MNDSDSNHQGQSLWSVTKSVLASFAGIQSSEKHAEDFKQGKASSYIFIGVVATVVFILSVFGVVKLVMSIAQPG